MEFHEVKSLRERRFGLTPKTAIRDASGAREFIHRVGFCFTWAEDGLLLPSFMEAVLLPKEPIAAAPAKAVAAKPKRPPAPRSGEEIILPLLREKSVFEGRLLRERRTLISSPFLPYFYALVGEGSPAAEPPGPAPAPEPEPAAAALPDGDGALAAKPAGKAARKAKAPAKPKTAAPAAAKKKKKDSAPPPPPAGDGGASEAYVILEREGPLGARSLASKYEKETGRGEDELNAALRRLESRLRVATIDVAADEGPVYDTFERFRPDAVREGKKLTRVEAAMRILGRYFETAIAAETSQVANVFGDIFPPSELPDLLKTLEERKEVDPDTRLVAGRTYWICREAAWGDL